MRQGIVVASQRGCRCPVCGAKCWVMAETANRLESLRFNRRDAARWGVALALSLALHLLVFGGYKLSRQLHLFPWLALLTHKLAWVLPPPPKSQEEPLQFVMVEQPSTEAPKKPKYYSSQNSLAANPEVNRNDKNPRLNGRQTDYPKTETSLRPDVHKLQTLQPASQEEAQPAPASTPGDLTLGKPKTQQQQSERPRKLSQVLPHHLPGLESFQDGGVQRHALVSSFDTEGTVLGNYDAAFIDAVQQYWDDELERINYASAETGKVQLQFRLNYDGRISDLKVVQTTVGSTMTLMCEMAILNPAPYAPWPEDMRHMFGLSRDITFTFYYY